MAKTFEIAETVGLALTFYDHGSAGAGTVTPDLANGAFQKTTCSAATRTIAAPVFNGGTAAGVIPVGTILAINVSNTSGGALTVTWNAIFKGAPANPGTGTQLTSLWLFNGTNWILLNEGVTDIPN